MDHTRRRDDIQIGSEKAFGIVFAVVFVIVALFPLIDGGDVWLWSLGIAAAFLLCAFVAPAVLRPLNIVWFKFGLLLHKIMTPLVMGVLFFLTVVPTGLIFKMLGKDPLRLKRQPTAESYWIKRDHERTGTMNNQF
jgi:hypothetical protein